jgi:hypothetical protein
VSVGVGDGVLVGADVSVGVGVSLGVGVGVFEGIEVGVGVSLGSAVRVAVASAITTGLGASVPGSCTIVRHPDRNPMNRSPRIRRYLVTTFIIYSCENSSVS